MTGGVVCRVGDLCDQIRGVTYSKHDAVMSPMPGYKPVLRANNISRRGLEYEDLVYVPAARISLRQHVMADDVVVAVSSGSLDVVGKAARAVADFDGGFGAFCKVLRPNAKVHPGYFAHFFQTRKYRQKVSSLAAGASISNLRNEHLDELEIVLPSMDEQRRIAAVLDKAGALAAGRREAIARIDQLLQSVFLDMFGDPVTNPKGVEQIPLGELATVRTGKRDANASSSDGKYPFFTCAREPLRIPSYSYDCECVLVAGNGDLNVKQYSGKFDAYQRTYIVESIDRSRLSTNYLYFFLDAYLDELRRQRIGGIIKYIRRANLTGAPLPLPSVMLQEAFDRRCLALNAQRAKMLNAGTRTIALLDDLQQRAFSGAL